MAVTSVAVTISSEDPRSLRALDVLAGADTWARGHRKSDGHAFFVIPASKGNSVYWTDCRSCTCPDFVRHQLPCKHTLAVKMWNARERQAQAAKERRQSKRASQPAPAPEAEAVPANVVSLDEQRAAKVLRHLATPEESKRLAHTYDEIFGTDEDAFNLPTPCAWAPHCAETAIPGDDDGYCARCRRDAEQDGQAMSDSDTERGPLDSDSDPTTTTHKEAWL